MSDGDGDVGGVEGGEGEWKQLFGDARAAYNAGYKNGVSNMKPLANCCVVCFKTLLQQVNKRAFNRYKHSQ